MRPSKLIMMAMMSIFVWAGMVGLLTPSVMADDTLASFEGGIGVIPVSSGVGTAATAEVVNRNIVRGVQPAGQIWVIMKLEAKVLPNETVDTSRTIELGDTTLELSYVGLNHSDSSLVMRLPKEKIIFAVGFIPVGSIPGRGMIDSYPLEWEDSLKQVLAAEPPDFPAGCVVRGQGGRARGQMLGGGREGTEAAKI